MIGSGIVWCKYYTNWDGKRGISVCCPKLCFHSCAFFCRHFNQTTRYLSARCQ